MAMKNNDVRAKDEIFHSFNGRKGFISKTGKPVSKKRLAEKLGVSELKLQQLQPTCTNRTSFDKWSLIDTCNMSELLGYSVEEMICQEDLQRLRKEVLNKKREVARVVLDEIEIDEKRTRNTEERINNLKETIKSTDSI